MKDSKGYVESRQLHKEGYLQENRVELEGSAGVQSISMASEGGRRGYRQKGVGIDP